MTARPVWSRETLTVFSQESVVFFIKTVSRSEPETLAVSVSVTLTDWVLFIGPFSVPLDGNKIAEILRDDSAG
jgi:hypothetical protein